MNWHQIIVALFLGITVTVLGWHYKTYPPKRINWWYGYRTKRTMANQEVWNYANKLGGKLVFNLGTFISVFGNLAAVVFSEVHFIIALLVIVLLGISAGFYWGETQLNTHFDKKGNPKSKT